MRQTIESYLRNIITLKVNNFLESAKCSLCGETNNLVFHHDKGFEFVKILNESLALLEYQYRRFVDEYYQKELNIIELVVLGRHMSDWHIVVCNVCHMEKYSNHRNYNYYYKRYKNQIDFYREFFPDSSLDDFIDNFNYFYLSKICKENIGENLYSNEILSLRKNIKNNILPIRKNYDYRYMGIRIINKILELYDIPYLISSKRCTKRGDNRDKWYWNIISK